MLVSDKNQPLVTNVIYLIELIKTNQSVKLYKTLHAIKWFVLKTWSKMSINKTI